MDAKGKRNEKRKEKKKKSQTKNETNNKNNNDNNNIYNIIINNNNKTTQQQQIWNMKERFLYFYSMNDCQHSKTTSKNKTNMIHLSVQKMGWAGDGGGGGGGGRGGGCGPGRNGEGDVRIWVPQVAATLVRSFPMESRKWLARSWRIWYFYFRYFFTWRFRPCSWPHPKPRFPAPSSKLSQSW